MKDDHIINVRYSCGPQGLHVAFNIERRVIPGEKKANETQKLVTNKS